MCSKVNINAACRNAGVFSVDFDYSQHINIVFLLLSFNQYLPVECERQVIMFSENTKNDIFVS